MRRFVRTRRMPCLHANIAKRMLAIKQLPANDSRTDNADGHRLQDLRHVSRVRGKDAGLNEAWLNSGT